MSAIWLAVFAALPLPGAEARTMQSATTQTAKAPPKIAVFTFSGGFKHDVLELAETTIAEISARDTHFDVVLHHQYRQDPDQLDLSMFNSGYLKQFAGILFYTTSGKRDKDLLNQPQRKALMDAIKGGAAFIGVHSAADTFFNWPEYGEMIGGYFDGQPWTADSLPVTLKIEDPDHPACQPIGSSWFLQEEIYQFRAPYDRGKLHVLLSLDTDASDMTVSGIKRKDGDFAVAWSKYHGKGRVFYTALGHRADVWKNKMFQDHLRGGIRWALGLAEGNPPPPGVEQEKFITTRSGIKYRDIVVGTGKRPLRFELIRVHYTGWLVDGTKFDSSYDAGKPFEFALGVGAVIHGWDEGIETMRVGGKRKMIIPPGRAYGVRGFGDRVPPNATLIFEIELLGARLDDRPQQP